METTGLEVPEQVRRICSDVLRIQEEEVTLELNFAHDLGAIELDIVDIVVDIEIECSKKGIELFFTDEEIDEIKTVGNLVELLAEKGVLN